jgi:hypothetical protein
MIGLKTNEETDGGTDRQMNTKTKRQTDEQKNRQADRWAGIQINTQKYS